MTGKKKARYLLTTFALGHLSNDWAPASIWLLAPAIALAMDLSPAEVGLLIFIHSLGAGLAYLPAGILADRVPNQGRLLLATFWWVALGYLLASFSPGFWSLAVLLAIAGMGDSAWHPIATGVLVKELSGRRAQVLGWHAMGGTLAEVLAPLTVGLLLAFFDWRTVLQLSTIPAFLMGILFLRISRQVPASSEHALSRADVRELARVWLEPRGLGLIALLIIYSMALMAMMSMTPLFLQDTHGYSSAQAGAVFALILLTGSLLQPFVGRLSDVAGRKRVFVAGVLLAIVGASMAVLAEAGVVLVGALILAIAALVAVRSGLLAVTVEHASRRAATTLGFVFAVMDGVGALGALLAGLAGEVDLRHAFTLAAVLCAITVAIALCVPFRSEPDSVRQVPVA